MAPLSLAEKVARRFMLGFAGSAPNPITRRFLASGLGGIIFFRDNFEPWATMAEARTMIAALKEGLPAHIPDLLLGIDQEGGPVERLPHTYFPTGLSPMGVALSENPEALAEDLYTMTAAHLAGLGLNLDFFPTLDVNLEPRNPIIGVRSFGDDPQAVARLGKIAMQALQGQGVIPVGKHFPGHGNGTVDSHLDLPTLHFTETELAPFRALIEAGLPAMLVAHGYYPALQDAAGESHLPSSASPAIIRGLLRGQLGFKGVILTDDMCMGAITRHRGAVEAALLALEAGVDILLYKQSTEAEWAVFEAVVAAYESGRLDPAELDAAVARIDRLLSAHPARSADSTGDPRIAAVDLARRGIRLLAGSPDVFPLNPAQPVLLVHPDRSQLGNYALDIPTSPELPAVFEAAGFQRLAALAYPPRESAPLAWPDVKPATVVMVSFNPLQYPHQAVWHEEIRARYPDARRVVVSAGTAYDGQALEGMHAHISWCNYRPAAMRALAEWLLTPPAR